MVELTLRVDFRVKRLYRLSNAAIGAPGWSVTPWAIPESLVDELSPASVLKKLYSLAAVKKELVPAKPVWCVRWQKAADTRPPGREGYLELHHFSCIDGGTSPQRSYN